MKCDRDARACREHTELKRSAEPCAAGAKNASTAISPISSLSDR